MNKKGTKVDSQEEKKSTNLLKIEQSCYTYLTKNCREQFLEVLNCVEGRAHYPILVDYIPLFEEYPAIGELLLKSPQIVLSLFDTVAKRVFIEIYEEVKDANNFEFSPHVFKCKQNLHIRIHSLPVCAELMRTEFPSYKDVGTFFCLMGTVVRAASAKVLEYSKMYQCKKCKEIVHVAAPPSLYHAFPKFAKCPNQCTKGKACPMGDSSTESLMIHSKFRDFQEIKLQEQVNKMDVGSTPRTINCILEEDLVDSCKPGDDVAITGYLYLRWKAFKPGVAGHPTFTFKANHLLVNNDIRMSMMVTDEMNNFVQSFWNYYEPDPFQGRNIIISSFCPQVYGMYVVKLAMCMVLAGGVSRKIGGARIRGESHILLVGDPGTGKSQILKYVAKLSPRSVFTTGIGASSAGLTVSAVKDHGEWQLEAGALVLADGGVCCIDEFACIKEHDRTSIHEAMEQQSISIAKAGMVVKLQTRVTLIAATNPKSKYDPDQPLQVNVAIATPLLSRFDVVMVLTDAENSDWDNFISDFILGEKNMLTEAMKTSEATDIWDMERLQSYLVMIKGFEPVMSDDAGELISTYYRYQRGLKNRNLSRTTVRLLESLRRLSEGHARLMFRNEVIIYDVINAIALLEVSMQSSAIVGSTNSLHVAFPVDPMEEYRNQARVILEKLQLHDIWEVERKVIDDFMTARANKRNGITVSAGNGPLPPKPPSPRPSTSKAYFPPRIEIPEVSQEVARLNAQEEIAINSINNAKRCYNSSGSESDFSELCDKQQYYVLLDKNGKPFGQENKRTKFFSSSEEESSETEDEEQVSDKCDEHVSKIDKILENAANIENLTPATARKKEIRTKLNRFKKARVIQSDDDDN